VLSRGFSPFLENEVAISSSRFEDGVRGASERGDSLWCSLVFGLASSFRMKGTDPLRGRAFLGAWDTSILSFTNYFIDFIIFLHGSNTSQLRNTVKFGLSEDAHSPSMHASESRHGVGSIMDTRLLKSLAIDSCRWMGHGGGSCADA